MKKVDKYTYLILLVVFIVIGFGAPSSAENFGVWSLIPPVVMFGFIMITQKVLEGFIWGGLLAVFLKYRGDTIVTYNEKIIEQVTNPDNLWLMLVLLLIGSIAAILEQSGLSKQFGLWASSKAKDSKMALIINYVTGVFLSFDLYLSASTVGTCITPVNDKYKIPREKTAMITLAPAISLTHLYPIGTGAIFISGLLVVNGYASTGEGIASFMKIVPLLFFPIAFLIITFLNVIGLIPNLGAMRKVYQATNEIAVANEVMQPMTATGETLPTPMKTNQESNLDEDSPPKKSPHLINFFLPILIFIASTIYFGSNTQLGAFLTILATGVLFIVQGIFTPEKYINATLDGMKNMLELVAIMATAFVLANSITEIGFTEYVIGLVSALVIPKLLPIMIFTIFSVTEFLVTLNWSLYIMAIPILLEISQAVGANTPLTIAALISAGLWGATTCITSDIGLLTAYSTKVKVYDHFKTKLPYCILAWILSAIAYLVGGLFF
ncbi:Na+/H+ antiporter NhaC family protein [Robertmurraya sp.]|uniref:Na+/H+ antiporter NhaC family protein n=1 Tax=Robertmurraya sp. TaxID=2837525 RepID=UPI003704127A